MASFAADNQPQGREESLYHTPCTDLGETTQGSPSAPGKSDAVLHHAVPAWQVFSYLTGVLQAEPTSGTLEG